MLVRESLTAPSGATDVIRTLEHFLALAQQGKVSHVAVSAVSFDKPYVTQGSAGAMALEEKQLGVLRDMVDHLDRVIRNRTPPLSDPDLGADFVCYDLARGPAGFDFVNWLVAAEMTRRREKAPAPLKVAFFAGRDKPIGLEAPGRRAMFENVMRSALGLIGAVEDETALRGRCPRVYIQKPVCAAARRGEAVPLLRASEWAKDEMASWLGYGMPAPVVVVLREWPDWPHRNSNLDAWFRFATDLEAQGERVVFVRDTARATEPLMGWLSCPRASRSLDHRMALYEHAKAVLTVSNGPAVLAHYSGTPWLTFVEVKDDGHPYYPSTPEFYRKNAGIEVGGQYPWSKPDQRLVWKRDDYENLVEAWKALCA